MALTGSYRKLISKPLSLEYELMTFQDIDDDEPAPGPVHAVRFQFALPSSSYATMCVRELTGDATTI